MPRRASALGKKQRCAGQCDWADCFDVDRVFRNNSSPPDERRKVIRHERIVNVLDLSFDG